MEKESLSIELDDEKTRNAILFSLEEGRKKIKKEIKKNGEKKFDKKSVGNIETAILELGGEI